MKKIEKDDITGLSSDVTQGGSWNTLYNGLYENNEVIIKAQDKGSLEKTNHEDDRFLQELKALKLNLPGTVNCFGHGDNWDGERFIVLEKLHHNQSLSNLDNLMRAMTSMLITSRQLSLKGFDWATNVNHILFDKSGAPKLIDFNDGCDPRPFENRSIEFIEKMCQLHGHSDSKEIVIKHAFDYLIQEEFKSLENVHDPVYFQDYSHLRRTETEFDDPMYGQLVSPNRKCHDRAKMIHDSLMNITGTSLDIGCNTGWFTFFFDSLGFNATGVDNDDRPGEHRPEHWKNGTGGKIEFARMIAAYKHRNVKFDFARVDLEYVQRLPKYDVISALSILHLFLEWPKRTSGLDTISNEYWLSLFTTLARKANKVFIFEIPDRILPGLGFTYSQIFYNHIKEACQFKEVIKKGNTDNGRPLVACYR
tara:strand:+ start:170 stop:1432 length:1263 start_codon:yes stop_codon:yes gene_type:complete